MAMQLHGEVFNGVKVLFLIFQSYSQTNGTFTSQQSSLQLQPMESVTVDSPPPIPLATSIVCIGLKSNVVVCKFTLCTHSCQDTQALSDFTSFTNNNNLVMRI